LEGLKVEGWERTAEDRRIHRAKEAPDEGEDCAARGKEDLFFQRKSRRNGKSVEWALQGVEW